MKLVDLANAILNKTLGPEKPEISTSWTVCIPNGQGGVQRYDTTSLIQAEATLNDWLIAGWPAWIQDGEGNLVHSIGTKSLSLN